MPLHLSLALTRARTHLASHAVGYLALVVALVAVPGYAAATRPTGRVDVAPRAAALPTAYQAQDATSTDLTTSYAVIERLRLPAGTYLLSADVLVVNASQQDQALDCRLVLRGRYLDSRPFVVLASTFLAGERQSVSLASSTHLTRTRPVTLQCKSTGDGTRAQFPSLTALRVGRLHLQ